MRWVVKVCLYFIYISNLLYNTSYYTSLLTFECHTCITSWIYPKRERNMGKRWKNNGEKSQVISLRRRPGNSRGPQRRCLDISRGPALLMLSNLSTVTRGVHAPAPPHVIRNRTAQTFAKPQAILAWHVCTEHSYLRKSWPRILSGRVSLFLRHLEWYIARHFFDVINSFRTKLFPRWTHPHTLVHTHIYVWLDMISKIHTSLNLLSKRSIHRCVIHWTYGRRFVKAIGYT